MSEDSDSSYTDSTDKSASSEHSPARKRKRPNVVSSDYSSDESQDYEEPEKIARQNLRTPSKTAKIANERTPKKNTPNKNENKSIRQSVLKRKSSSGSNNTSTVETLQYDCKLCEGTFKSKPARNIHYTGTHKVENEKLLFFPDGTGLVESSLEQHVKLKPDHLKTAARNMSSRVCKLCKVELDMDDLKWHYEDVHKVIQMSKVKPIICLNNSDIKIIAEPFKCENCSRTFDDVSRLKTHVLTHRAESDKIKCKFCSKSFNRTEYNHHVKKKHPEKYFQTTDTSGENVEKETHKKNVCSSKGAQMRQRRRSDHKVNEKQKKTNKKCQNNNVTAESKEMENIDKESEVNSTSEQDLNCISVPTQAIMLYLCEACDFATTSYDEAVTHSQDQILNIVTETTLCELCNLKFGSDYQTHKELHAINSELDIDSFQCIPFDHRLLFTEKWFDMFDFLPKVKIQIITADHSVYFSTRCIRFKWAGSMNETSAPFFLFQCETCNHYVDPFSIESHVQQQSCSVDSNSYPCAVCQRQFFSEVARIQHSDTHKVPNADAKYRTILFNNQSDLGTNELLLKASNKSAPKSRNNVIAGNVATQVELNNQTEITQNTDKAKENNDLKNEPENLATVYKCRCGICFHTLPDLFDHLQKCSNTFEVERETCKCGLVFDSQHYPLHVMLHCCYTTIVVKEITIKPVRRINIGGMVDDFKKNNTPPRRKTEPVNKVIEANYIKPSNVMDDGNKSQEPTYKKDKIEGLSKSKLLVKDTQHEIQEKMANPKSIHENGHNKSQPIISSGTENSKKPNKIQILEKTVLTSGTDTSAEKSDVVDTTKNKQAICISNEDINKVINLYNYIKDVMINKAVTIAEPETAMEVVETNNKSSNTPDDSTWRNNARNKEVDQSLVATTIEVEAQILGKNIVESNGKEKNEINKFITKDDDESNVNNSSSDFKRNIMERCRRENEMDKETTIITDIKSEPNDSEITEYDEEELLKDNETDYTICPDVIDLLTDDED